MENGVHGRNLRQISRISLALISKLPKAASKPCKRKQIGKGQQ